MKEPEDVVTFLTEKRDEIIADERMGYKTATVQVNAPLALIQMSMTAQLSLIEHALGLPRTPVPIEK